MMLHVLSAFWLLYAFILFPIRISPDSVDISSQLWVTSTAKRRCLSFPFCVPASKYPERVAWCFNYLFKHLNHCCFYFQHAIYFRTRVLILNAKQKFALSILITQFSSTATAHESMTFVSLSFVSAHCFYYLNFVSGFIMGAYDPALKPSWLRAIGWTQWMSTAENDVHF